MTKPKYRPRTGGRFCRETAEAKPKRVDAEAEKIAKSPADGKKSVPARKSDKET